VIAERADIEVESQDGHFSAYVAVPNHPNGVAVVVLQEIFGVNANIRAIADRFADAGFAAVAPDLYWRQQRDVRLDPASAEGREAAMGLMKGLDRNQSVADGAAALAALRGRVAGLDRSAAVGYCFGGGVAALMGARGVVDAGVAYYGTGLQTLLDEIEASMERLLLHIAGDDHLCPPDAQQAILAVGAKHPDRIAVTIHEGVGHAFARIGGATFDRQAADRANAATMALLTSLAEG
jgi:carboxymethylenebutenolidase